MTNNMASLDSMLRLYFNYESNYHEPHKVHIAKYYDSIKRREMFKIDNDKYNIQARMGYVNILKTKTSFWMYVADQEIWKRASEKANVPLHSMPDCEYMYYGMYLNCFAFLYGTKIARLVLIHSPTGDLLEFKWKPKLAEELLDHYLSKRNLENQVILDL